MLLRKFYDLFRILIRYRINKITIISGINCYFINQSYSKIDPPLGKLTRNTSLS